MIRVPENWPMAWWSADQSLIRLSCPACGQFSMFADRSNGTPKIACRECGLNGAKQVQQAMDAWVVAHQDALDHDAKLQREAQAENNTSIARLRQAGRQK